MTSQVLRNEQTASLICAQIPRAGTAKSHGSEGYDRIASRWEISFRVTDVDESTSRAEELGGSVLFPPIDIPIGRFSIVSDNAGAAFTITEFPAGPFRGVDGS